ncbi:microtubule-associated protein futsch isoform X1 [Penaeus vannamei]|uniref:microtubule-associated protein futsch isoform X1 n=1 Tax=Penaeus vannamei TaxID=6689 RepID=UPI00387F8329
MSASRGGRLSRKRKKEEDCLTFTSIHDITDDFQEAATVFRVPKKAKTEKPPPAPRQRGRPKKSSSVRQNLQTANTTSGNSSKNEDSSPEILDEADEFEAEAKPKDINLEKDTEAQQLGEDEEFLELEQSVCSESEKLCPSCKHIVPSALIGDHIKECMQKFKLVRRRSERNSASTKSKAKEEDIEDDEVLPCPGFSKSIERILQNPPAKPEVREKTKSSATTEEAKNRREAIKTAKNAKNDPDLAMALALSRSMVEDEAEKRASREEKLLELGLDDIVEEDRKVQPLLLPLQSASGKSQSSKGPAKGKGKKRNAVWRNTVLLNRSKEERENIISEKVAALLASEDTQRNEWTGPGNGCRNEPLLRYKDKSCSLWEAAHSHVDQPLREFYVPDLEPYIEPKKVAVGGLLRRLSQIPGRLNLTAMDENSDSDSDEEGGRSYAVDRDSTQSVLAELLGSQDCLDITRAHNAIEAEDLSKFQEFEDAAADPNVTMEAASGFWVFRLPGESSEDNVEGDKETIEEKDEGNERDSSDAVLVTGSACDSDESHIDKGVSDGVKDDQADEDNSLSSETKTEEMEVDNMQKSKSVAFSTIDLVDSASMEFCVVDDKMVMNSLEKSDKDKLVNTFCDLEDDTSCDTSENTLLEDVRSEKEVSKQVPTNCDDIEPTESDGSEDCEISIILDTSSGRAECNKDKLHESHHEVEVSSVSPKYKDSSSKEQEVNDLEPAKDFFDNDSNSSMNSAETQIFTENQDSSFNASFRQRLHTEETILYSDSTDLSLVTSSYGDCQKRKQESEHLNRDEEGRVADSYKTRDKVGTSTETRISSDLQARGSNIRQGKDGKGEQECKEKYSDKSEPRSPDPLHAKLIYDWASLLASSEGADFTITTSEGSDLQVHSFVMLVRCPKLYQEVRSAGKKVTWTDICFEGAYVFLSYIYTGTCKIKAKDDSLWMDVFDLALKYECDDLVTYLESLYKAHPSPVKVATAVNSKDSMVNTDVGIMLTPKMANSQEEGIIKKRFRRCIDLSPGKSISVSSDKGNDDLTTEPVLQPSDSSELMVMSSNPEKDDGKGSSQSPDLFNESCVNENTTHKTFPSVSIPMLSELHHSPWDKALQDVHEEPSLSLSTESKTSKPVSYAKSDYFKSNKQDISSSASPDFSKMKPVTDAGNLREQSEGQNLRGNEEVEDMDVNDSQEDEETDIIDLTVCSSGSSRSVGTKADTLITPGVHVDAPTDSESEYMEPLMLADGTDTNSEENENCPEEPCMAAVNIMQATPNKSLDTDYNKQEESKNRSYISNVWDDFDDMGCELLPIEVSPTTPVKAVVAPAVKGHYHDKEFQVSYDNDSVSPIQSISPTKVADEGVIQNRKWTPVKQTSKTVDCEGTKDRPIFDMESKLGSSATDAVVASGSSFSDETLLRVAAEFEDSNIWKDDFDSIDDVSDPLLKKDAEKKLPKSKKDLLKTPNDKIGPSKKSVTPMPDYKNMPSPDLKKELEKYGIRPISRRKATILLQHVYEQTHPLVTDSEAESSFCETPQRKPPEKNKKSVSSLHQKVMAKKGTLTKNKKERPNNKKEASSQPLSSLSAKQGSYEEGDEDFDQLNSSQTSNTSTDGSEFDCAEESMMVGIGDDDDVLTSTQQVDIGRKVAKFIKCDPELYMKILLYEPIFVEDLQASLKANGIKTNMNNLLEILDEQCITFRTQQGQRNRSRKRKSPKKKTAASPTKSPKKNS